MKIEDRFWSKVTVVGECLEWVAAKRPNGYGAFSIYNKLHLPHRVAYEMTVGPIENGAVVCHWCDNPACVDPNHLFMGSQSDNMHDCIDKGRYTCPTGPSTQPVKHGTEWAYKARCRCDTCRSAYSKIRHAKWLRRKT